MRDKTIGCREIIIAVLAVAFALIGTGCSKKLNSPESLLREIYELATEQRYDELKELGYPLTFQDNDIRDLFVKGIREKETSGDWAYSDAALKEIIENHLDKIGPLPQKELDRIIKRSDTYGETLVNLAKNSPESYSLFNHKQTFIVLVKIEEEYRLLFWEDITNILN